MPLERLKSFQLEVEDFYSASEDEDDDNVSCASYCTGISRATSFALSDVLLAESLSEFDDPQLRRPDTESSEAPPARLRRVGLGATADVAGAKPLPRTAEQVQFQPGADAPATLGGRAHSRRRGKHQAAAPDASKRDAHAGSAAADVASRDQQRGGPRQLPGAVASTVSHRGRGGGEDDAAAVREVVASVIANVVRRQEDEAYVSGLVAAMCQRAAHGCTPQGDPKESGAAAGRMEEHAAVSLAGAAALFAAGRPAAIVANDVPPTPPASRTASNLGEEARMMPMICEQQVLQFDEEGAAPPPKGAALTRAAAAAAPSAAASSAAAAPWQPATPPPTPASTASAAASSNSSSADSREAANVYADGGIFAAVFAPVFSDEGGPTPVNSPAATPLDRSLRGRAPAARSARAARTAGAATAVAAAAALTATACDEVGGGQEACRTSARAPLDEGDGTDAPIAAPDAVTAADALAPPLQGFVALQDIPEDVPVVVAPDAAAPADATAAQAGVGGGAAIANSIATPASGGAALAARAASPSRASRAHVHSTLVHGVPLDEGALRRRSRSSSPAAAVGRHARTASNSSVDSVDAARHGVGAAPCADAPTTPALRASTDGPTRGSAGDAADLLRSLSGPPTHPEADAAPPPVEGAAAEAGSGKPTDTPGADGSAPAGLPDVDTPLTGDGGMPTQPPTPEARDDAPAGVPADEDAQTPPLPLQPAESDEAPCLPNAAVTEVDVAAPAAADGEAFAAKADVQAATRAGSKPAADGGLPQQAPGAAVSPVIEGAAPAVVAKSAAAPASPPAPPLPSRQAKARNGGWFACACFGGGDAVVD